MNKEPDSTKDDNPKLAGELIYDHIKEAPQQQMEFASQLDDKILRIFSAASIVLGLLGLSTINVTGLKALLFLVPLIPYALTAFWTFSCIDPDRFHWAMRADQQPKSWDKEEEDVRNALERFSLRLQGYAVSAVVVEAADVFGGDRIKRLTRRFYESFLAPRSRLPQDILHLGEGLFYGIHVRRVGWEE